MGAQTILTNLAVLLVVGTVWGDMRRNDRMFAAHKGRLITAGLFALISLGLHFLERLNP